MILDYLGQYFVIDVSGGSAISEPSASAVFLPFTEPAMFPADECPTGCGAQHMDQAETDMRHWLRRSKVPYFFLCQSDGSPIGEDGKYREPYDNKRWWKRPDFMVKPPNDAKPLAVEVRTAQTFPDPFYVDKEGLEKGVKFALDFGAFLFFAFSYREAGNTVYWLKSSSIFRPCNREKLLQAGRVEEHPHCYYVKPAACFKTEIGNGRLFGEVWVDLKQL